jgi:hypothetical protein
MSLFDVTKFNLLKDSHRTVQADFIVRAQVTCESREISSAAHPVLLSLLKIYISSDGELMLCYALR